MHPTGRYSRHENAKTPVQIAAEVRRHVLENERRKRRAELTERQRIKSRHDTVMQELSLVQGMAAIDWDMEEID